MTFIVVLAMLPFGLIVGSILSMVATRVPDEVPVFTPGPACPGCEHQLRASELIPLVSWLRQGRSCVHCDAQISAAYPAIEVATAALFALFALKFEASWFLIPHLIFGAALIALSVTDLYLYRIPDRIVFPTLGVSAALIAVISAATDSSEMILPAFAGMLGYFALLFVVWFIYPPGIGFGDVKLALLLGLFLGWTSNGSYLYTSVFVAYALFIGCMLFAAMSGVIIFARSRGLDLLPDPLEEDYVGSAGMSPNDFDDAADDEHDARSYELDRGAGGAGDMNEDVDDEDWDEEPTEDRKIHTGAPMGPALALGTLIVMFFPGAFA